MARRLILLGLVSALLAIALVVLSHIAFPDILPLPDSDPDQSTWRFDAAYFVTALAWAAAEISAFSLVGLVGMFWSNEPPTPFRSTSDQPTRQR
jgi:hypothetical protein